MMIGVNDLLATCTNLFLNREEKEQAKGAINMSDTLIRVAACIDGIAERYRCMLRFLRTARPHASIIIQGLFPTIRVCVCPTLCWPNFHGIDAGKHMCDTAGAKALLQQWIHQKLRHHHKTDYL